MLDGEQHRVHRVERFEYDRRLRNAEAAHDGERDEPHHRNRPEQLAHAACALLLDQEQSNQNAYRDGDDEFLELWGGDADALHRREHRYGGRDNGVAVKERRCENACRDDESRQAFTVFAVFNKAMRQCGEREHAAFAFVVQLQNQPHVFD